MKINWNEKEKSIKELQNKINNERNSEFEVIDLEKNQNPKQSYHIILKHKKCGNIYRTNYQKFFSFNRGCPKCNMTVDKWNPDSFKKYVENISNGEYKVLEDYKNTKTKIKFKHIKCNSIYEATPNKFLYGRRCPICANNTLKDFETAKKSILEKTNGQFELIGEYKGKSIETEFIHIGGCKNKFFAKPANLYRREKIFCPKCTKQSIGESITKNVLNELSKTYKITFKEQFRFDDCKDKRTLPFDFAVFKNDKLLFLIEFDGPQHRRIDSEKIKSKFYDSSVIEHDKIKNKYCKNNNISLLRLKTPKEITIKNKIIKQLESSTAI